MDLMSILMVRKARLRKLATKIIPDRIYHRDEAPKTIHKVHAMLQDYPGVRICDYCDGTGEIQHIENGKVLTHVCTVCGGSGVVESNEVNTNG